MGFGNIRQNPLSPKHRKFENDPQDPEGFQELFPFIFLSDVA
jgi:hypothetical protein